MRLTGMSCAVAGYFRRGFGGTPVVDQQPALFLCDPATMFQRNAAAAQTSAAAFLFPLNPEETKY
jgi:hypothetical protein